MTCDARSIHDRARVAGNAELPEHPRLINLLSCDSLLPSWTPCWDGSPPPPLETLGRRWHDVPPRSQHEVHAWEAVAGGEVTRASYSLGRYRICSHSKCSPRRALGCVKDGFLLSLYKTLMRQKYIYVLPGSSSLIPRARPPRVPLTAWTRSSPAWTA